LAAAPRFEERASPLVPVRISAMFHLELRQFPHATNAFNWTRDELEARVLRPWAAGKVFELDDRKWSPEKAKLTIYEGRALEVEEMGMGRGWGNVTRSGEDVTERVLSEAGPAGADSDALDALKAAVVERAGVQSVGYYELLGLAAELAPGASDEQRLALAANAVWELLRDERLRLGR
jgi:hypothetical protein